MSPSSSFYHCPTPAPQSESRAQGTSGAPGRTRVRLGSSLLGSCKSSKQKHQEEQPTFRVCKTASEKLQNCISDPRTFISKEVSALKRLNLVGIFWGRKLWWEINILYIPMYWVYHGNTGKIVCQNVLAVFKDGRPSYKRMRGRRGLCTTESCIVCKTQVSI